MSNPKFTDSRSIEEMVRFGLEEFIPFNKVLGLKLASAEPIKATFEMRPELVGNPALAVLHGGVISAVIDAVGGIAIIQHLLLRDDGLSLDEKRKQFTRVGTIDLRIDYLKPGRGTQFYTTAKLLKAGRTIMVVRMDLYNQDDLLIAAGTGSYIVR
ncbi:MAG: thioesterase family protein [Chloroflexota bacterium]